MKFREVPHIFFWRERKILWGNAIFFGGNAKSFGRNGVPTRSPPTLITGYTVPNIRFAKNVYK